MSILSQSKFSETSIFPVPGRRTQHVHACMHAHTDTDTHTHTHIHTHTHTHTHKK